MKVVPFLLAAFLVAAPGSSQSTTVIEGRVVTIIGDQVRPVRRARVMLSGAGLSPSRQVDTDANGAYRFDRLSRGDYRILAHKPGYLHWIGKAVPDATITMVRGGAIEGAVLDPSGEPLRGASVSALKPSSGSFSPALAAHTYTDDLGRYRLHSLAAGDYVVEASSLDLTETALLRPGEKRGAETRTYYPAAETRDAARPVRVLSLIHI